MFTTNRQAREIIAIPAEQRTAEQSKRLSTWQSVEPEYDEVEFYTD